MKIKNIFFLIVLFCSTLYNIRGSYSSYYNSNILPVSFSAGVWEKDPVLSFYNENRNGYVGFTLNNVSKLEIISYVVSYEENIQGNDVPRAISGQVNNSSKAASIERGGIFLGSCSDESCILGNVSGTVNLNIELWNVNGLQKTLQSNLDI